MTRAAGLPVRDRWASLPGQWAPAGLTTTTMAILICSFPTTATGSRAPIRFAAVCAGTVARLLPPRPLSRTVDAALSQQRRRHIYRDHPQAGTARRPGQRNGPGHGRLCRRGHPASLSPTTMRATCCCATEARDSRRPGSMPAWPTTAMAATSPAWAPTLATSMGTDADIVMTGLKNETYEVFLNRGRRLFDDGSAQHRPAEPEPPMERLGLWTCGSRQRRMARSVRRGRRPGHPGRTAEPDLSEPRRDALTTFPMRWQRISAACYCTVAWSSRTLTGMGASTPR